MNTSSSPRSPSRTPSQAEAEAWGIQVDEQDTVSLFTQGRGEVDRGRGLSAGALWLLTAMVRKVYLETIPCEAHLTSVCGQLRTRDESYNRAQMPEIESCGPVSKSINTTFKSVHYKTF